MPGKAVKAVQTDSKSDLSKKSSQKKSPKNSSAVKSPSKAVGYLPVSTGDQELEKNKADILRLANDLVFGKERFVEEKISGKIPWRKRKVAGILDKLAKGDAIIVCEFSRLGRSMLECMGMLSLALTKGVSVYSVKGNWKLDDFRPEFEALEANGTTQKFIAQR